MIGRVALDRIDGNPYQTRSVETSVSELAASILHFAGSRPETSGLIQVPVGRIVLDGRVLNAAEYGGVAACLGDEVEARVELAAGHRRWRAFRQLAAMDEAYGTMPVDVGVLDEEEMADIAWQENAGREDISAIEEAEAIERAMERFGWTQTEVGRRWDLTQGAVSNKLRLLKLPEQVRAFMLKQWIGERHGRALLPLLQMGKAGERGMVGLLTHGSREARGADDFRSVAELEGAVRQYFEEKTLLIKWEMDWVPDGRGVPCRACDVLIKVGRQKRCRRADCYRDRERTYKIQVTGPGKARKLQQEHSDWKRERMTRSWQRCECCGRSRGEVMALQSDWWYTSRWRWICPECWERAGLPEVEMVEGEEIARAEAVPGAGAGTEGLVMRPVVDDEPVEPPEPPSPPATLVTARILDGEELARRRVMVAIAEEGKAPGTFRTGMYGELGELVVEMCEGYFLGNGVGSKE